MAAGAMEEVRADLPAAETETVRGVRIQAEATDEAATEEMAVPLETVMEETAGRADLPAAAMETVTEEPAVSEEETEETVTAVPEALAAEARIRTGIPETEATVTAAVLAEETAVVLPPLTVLSRQSQAAPVRPTRMLIRMTVLTRETGMRTERRHQRQERELSLCRSLRRKRQRLRM